MRHRKHNHQLGVKSAHRVSLVANLSCSLIENGRIKTTLAKARALRPAIEKVITLAKKAHSSDNNARKIHYRRVAIAKLRNKKAVSKLFDELVDQFLGRNGGYTRIYKLALPRLGDAADMALIEFVEEPTKKKTKKKKTSPPKDSKKKSSAKVGNTEEDPAKAEGALDSKEAVSTEDETSQENVSSVAKNKKEKLPDQQENEDSTEKTSKDDNEPETEKK